MGDLIDRLLTHRKLYKDANLPVPKFRALISEIHEEPKLGMRLGFYLMFKNRNPNYTLEEYLKGAFDVDIEIVQIPDKNSDKIT
jgi:hypothetical protein